MKPSHPQNIVGRLIGSALVVFLLAACGEAPRDSGTRPSASKPALSVTTTTPQVIDWPLTLKASGNIAAWQEAVIGPEISNFRITEVRANVGDVVKKGQVLARIAGDAVESEYAEIRASVAEAEATLAEARANHARARQLSESGFYSAQQATQTLTAADTALARLEGVQAKVADLMGIIDRGEGSLGRIANDPEFPEDAKELGKILKRTPLRVIGHPQDDEP